MVWGGDQAFVLVAMFHISLGPPGPLVEASISPFSSPPSAHPETGGSDSKVRKIWF